MRMRTAAHGLATVVALVLGSGSSALAAPGADPASPPARGASVAVSDPTPLVDLFGPYTDHEDYDLRFTVPATFTDHCVQNGGAGEFAVGSAYTFYGTTYFKTYRCTMLLTEDAELSAAGIPFELAYLLHSYYTNPHFPNPDKNSERYRFRTFDGGKYSTDFTAFQKGEYLAAFYYQGSPAGEDGWYYIYEVTCDPRAVVTGDVATPADVARECSESRMSQIADTATTGPTTMLADASTYDPYRED